jgi:hypothetical protein
MEARGLDPEVYDRVAAPERIAPQLPPVASGAPLVYLLDLPLLSGDESINAGTIVAAQSPWPGALAVYQSPDVTGFQLKAIVNAASVIGETVTALPSGPVSRIDHGHKLTVRIGNGQLTAATELQMLNGSNVAALRNSSGAWEVVQFITATLLAPQTYELSGLLRGQAGTEGAMQPILAAGSPFVLLGNASARVELTASQVGLPLNWRVGPVAKDIGSSNYTSVTHAFSGLAARPLSPVHVRGRRAGGDLTLSWIRQTRMGGDNWATTDVPLAEDSERYDVDILAGAVVKRTLTTTSTGVTYTAAMQTADFGTAPASVSVRVCQISATWGRGAATSAIV